MQMEAVRREDFAQQLRPTKRKSAADKLQVAHLIAGVSLFRPSPSVVNPCWRSHTTRAIVTAVRGRRGVSGRPGDTEEGMGATSAAVLQKLLNTAGRCG